MAEVLDGLTDWFKSLAGDWSKYTLVGSFVLYLIGYLALRFHLTALGMATDLSVVDERYLFTGARFFVYLVASIPISLVLVYAIWRLLRLLPASVLDVLSSPMFGIVFALLVIQLVMRQCFRINNLLLAADLSTAPPWLASLLLDNTYMLLYFSALIAACAVPLAILFSGVRERVPVLQRWLLGFLAAVQILLLPVNYGVLIVDKTLPRVESIGTTPLSAGEQAWLVWEGKEGVTFLVRNHLVRRRSLVTVPRAEIKRTEIVGFDAIVPTLFGSGRGGSI